MANEPLVIPEDPEEAKLESYRTVFELLKKPPQTAAELYQFLTALTGEYIPFQALCPDHITPWDYIWRAYRSDIEKWRKQSRPNIVYLGPRGGYKTLSVAKLIVAEMLLKPGCHTVGLGAIENHATTTYRYVQRYLNHPVIAELGLVKRMLMKETMLTNGSVYGQTVATMSGVNSLHTQKLRTEENDLMKREILEEAKLMVTSFNSLGAQTSYVSSRKFDGGIMDELVENSEAMNSDVLISCYKDTSEACPIERRGVGEKMYEVEDIYNPGDTMVVQAFDLCSDCPLLPSCRGDLARANGLVKIDDHIKDWHSLDRETWIFQKECRKAKKSELFFDDFNETIQMGAYPYRRDIGWFDMSFDFSGGGDDPTVVGFWQTDEKNDDYMFGELVFHRELVASVSRKVLEYVTERGLITVRHQLGDSAAQQWIQELNAQDSFFKVRPVRKIQRRDGWAICKQRLRDMNGQRHTFFDHSCRLIMQELKNAKKSKADPMDVKPGQSDHSLDQWRYRNVELRYHGLKQPNIRLITGEVARPLTLPFEDQSKKEEKASGYDVIERYLTEDD